VGSVKGFWGPIDAELRDVVRVLDVDGINAALGMIGGATGNHRNAVGDGTDGGAEGASGAILGDMGEMGLCIKVDGLIARVIACHVALSAVDAKVLIDESDDLLAVVEVVVVADTWEGKTDFRFDGADAFDGLAALGLDHVLQLETLGLEHRVFVSVELAELSC